MVDIVNQEKIPPEIIDIFKRRDRPYVDKLRKVKPEAKLADLGAGKVKIFWNV